MNNDFYNYIHKWSLESRVAPAEKDKAHTQVK